MKVLKYVAAALMIFGAIMLVAGIGAPLLWFAVITIGLALVAIEWGSRPRPFRARRRRP